MTTGGQMPQAAPMANAADEGGCSCRIGGPTPLERSALAGALAIFLAFIGRRRSRSMAA